MTAAPRALHSMTGWAQASAAEGECTVTVTLKSVNHRFLDLRWQAPAAFDRLQPELEKRLRTALRRGHVDIQIAISAGTAAGFELDHGAVAAYRRAWQALAPPGATGPDAHEMLRFPGVLVPAAPLAAALPEPLLAAAFDQALQRLNQMRVREGEALAGDLRARLRSLGEARAEVETLHAGLERELLERLRGRIQDLTGTAAPPERLLQEAALAAERSDIGEELARLAMHLAEAGALLSQGGEVGKKFDFLLQELHREVNTLLSKGAGASPASLRLAQLGLAMKADVEKLREQVQNLE